MKRNPTLEEKKQLTRLGINPENWLVCKHTHEQMTLKHKTMDVRKIIPASLLT